VNGIVTVQGPLPETEIVPTVALPLALALTYPAELDELA
jgi:hypothetical protein